jgi:uncharacterized protein YgiM (DUF1202 family)
MRVVQNTLGILLGLLTVALVVGGAGYFLLQQLSRSPAKPAFAAATPNTAKAEISRIQDGTYPALVAYQGDLIVRDAPASSGKVVDKITFEETVIVTGASDDGHWQKIRVGSKGIDGWISNGNLKRAQ